MSGLAPQFRLVLLTLSGVEMFVVAAVVSGKRWCDVG